MPELSSPTYQFASIKKHHAITIVTFNRPERKNALHPAAHHEMERIFDTLAEDNDVRCIILTGAGDAFCAGYDLRDNLETGVMEVAAKGFAGLTSRTDYPIPIIAAVNGVAMGGGFECVLASDIAIAADSALFALPEAKVGWSPLAGGLQRLPRAIGERRALSLVLTGRAIDAVEAERYGLIAEVVAPDVLMAAAMAWAEQIVACAPLAIACNREVVGASLDMPLAQSLNVDNFPSAAKMLRSLDATEGKQAFFEKRAPQWRGR